MKADLQRRLQRYGWDRAAASYAALWQAHLAAANAELLRCAALQPGQRVLDVACGTGAVTLAAAARVAPGGRVDGVDLSGQMVDGARQVAADSAIDSVDFARMDGEALALPDAAFDATLCAFGLMYMPEPERALCEMHRVLRPGGRLAVAVWGERARCGWSAIFEIVDQEVASEVCPLFFRLGQGENLVHACTLAGFERVRMQRIDATLAFVDADEASDAMLLAGPAALAWSRMDSATRTRVRDRYLKTLSPWRSGVRYRVPAEFVIVDAWRRPGAQADG